MHTFKKLLDKNSLLMRHTNRQVAKKYQTTYSSLQRELFLSFKSI